MKGPNHFYKACAEALGLDPSVVKKVNSFYFKRLKRELSEANHGALFIKHLGTIATSRYKLNKEIASIIAKIRRYRTSTRLTELKRKILLTEHTKNLTQLLRRRNEIAEALYKTKANVKVDRIPEPDPQGPAEPEADCRRGDQ